MITEDFPVRGPRPHLKSKLGCRRCKDRKIKCDERRPVCGNCSRRYGTLRPCCWDDQTNVQRKSKLPQTHHQTRVTSPEKPLCILHRKMRVVELRILHHYITQFAPQQPRWGRFGFEALDQFFVVDALQLGFGHEAVLSGLLGLSACHYLSLAPEDQDVNRAACEYLHQTIRYQASLVRGINESNAQTALLVSTLLFGMLKYRAVLVDTTELYRPPLEILYMMKGVGALYRRAMPFLPIDNHVAQWVRLRPKDVDADETSEQALPPTILTDSRKLRESLNTVSSPNAREIYTHTIHNYHRLLIALLREEDPDWASRRLYIMLGECPPDWESSRRLDMMGNECPHGFRDLVEREEPLALAILARFIGLTKLCEGSRYHHGVAEYELTGIASLMPTGWQWSMALPWWLLQLDRSHSEYIMACQDFQQRVM
ncbi:hypothetical protein GQ44DRAFT_714789 [Phaeosphaeriaceae sp. PMI808]|nr:hypothetical protein GQ44DRAFT_714789 [Phaeosphaeriaceae sp. PMI808]